MTQIDPIIAVNDVEVSSKWYQTVFNAKSIHGGAEFDVLQTKNNEVLICLHKWGEHDHLSMIDSNITVGNGLILYFRTTELETIRKNVESLNYSVVDEIKRNPNSNKLEFSLRDPDGYFLIISEFHLYKG